MNVLVIPEDFRRDQFILKPIVTAMLAHLGRPRAKVEVLKDPLLRGVSETLDHEKLAEIIRDNKYFVDLFLLCVDRDGNANRRAVLDGIETAMRPHLPPRRALLAENAWQEIEVWLLAGHDLPKGWKFADIRKEVSAKEKWYVPFAKTRGFGDGADGGRETLGREAAAQYAKRIRKRCGEDVLALETRIAEWMTATRVS